MRSDDVNYSGLMIFLGILLATMLLVYAVLTRMWHGFERRSAQADAQILRLAPPPAVVADRPYFPAPREQPNPLADLTALQARENAELNSYGWVDRSNGVVRIPIDRAIELLTQPRKGNP
jgi:hypothetical protein